MNNIDSKEYRKERIRAAKSELILDAALEILSQKGYYETRLEDIAEKAGFSKSALYRYYKDKDELFLNIVIREKNRIITRFGDYTEKISKEKHISENLRFILIGFFEILKENFSIILTLDLFQFFTWANTLKQQIPIEEIEDEFITHESKFSQIITQILNYAKEKGEISPSLNSDILFEFFTGIVLSEVKIWRRRKKVGNIEQRTEEILQFLSGGIGYKFPNQP